MRRMRGNVSLSKRNSDQFHFLDLGTGELVTLEALNYRCPILRLLPGEFAMQVLSLNDRKRHAYRLVATTGGSILHNNSPTTFIGGFTTFSSTSTLSHCVLLFLGELPRFINDLYTKLFGK
jgi:hypothetical protein